MSASHKDILLEKLRGGQPMLRREQLKLAWLLGLPAMLAQLGTIVMEYIDAGMVGRLGSEQAASIGLVATSTWIFGGFCFANSSGFSVQVSQLIGSRNYAKAREVMRKGFVSVLVFSLVLAFLGLLISPFLPHWLGGDAAICADASAYFAIFCAFLPVMQIAVTSCSMLQASGNMRIPSFVEVAACILDIALNYLFIYVLGMGVKGAALGTGLATMITHAFALWYVFIVCPELNILQDSSSWIPDKESLKAAFGISGPMWLQNIISRGAYVMSTVIVAPLGTIAIAANSFAITAESFCYMPGYGLSDAATSLVGQSIGAKRKDLARQFAYITTGLAAAMMTAAGVLMYIFAPQMMGVLTNDPEVIALGVKVLRIEAFAETLYAVSIIGYGSCVGAGDTMVPMVLNFASMWVVRIGLAFILTPKLGLAGYWIAMCIELNVRGLIFFLRIRGKRWMKKDFAE
jgi:putative MATE family efflux protein